jgi:hypothetical protein
VNFKNNIAKGVVKETTTAGDKSKVPKPNQKVTVSYIGKVLHPSSLPNPEYKTLLPVKIKLPSLNRIEKKNPTPSY